MFYPTGTEFGRAGKPASSYTGVSVAVNSITCSSVGQSSGHPYYFVTTGTELEAIITHTLQLDNSYLQGNFHLLTLLKAE